MNFFLKKFSLTFFCLLLITLIPNYLSLDNPLNNEYQLPLLNTYNSLSDSSLKFLSEPNQNSQNKILLNTQDSDMIYIDGKTGFNSYLNSFTNSECYNVSRTISGNISLVDQIDKTFSRDEIINLMKLNNPGSVDVRTLSLDSDKDIEDNFPEEADSTYFYYFVKLTRNREFKYDPLIENFLDESGRKLLEKSTTNKDQFFLLTCGDSVVKTVSEGGFIIFQVELDFNSIEKKINFDKFVRNNLGDLKTLDQKIKKNLQETGAKAILGFKVVQFGGNNSDLVDKPWETALNQCNIAVDSQITEETEKATEYCSKFLSDLNSYILINFHDQFTENSLNYVTFDFRKIQLEDLQLPKVNEDYFSQIRKFKQKVIDFKFVNDYYIANMNNFMKNYPVYNELEEKYREIYEFYYETLFKNNENILRNKFGNFQFLDCWINVNNCNMENFDNAYSSLQNIFEKIDDNLMYVKSVWNYDLKLSNCGIELEGGEIEVRIYSLGFTTYSIKYVDSNLMYKANFPNGWNWIEGKAKSYNEFEFQVHPLLDFARAYATPEGEDNWLKVRLRCNVMTTENVGVLNDNPYNFKPLELK